MTLSKANYDRLPAKEKLNYRWKTIHRVKTVDGGETAPFTHYFNRQIDAVQYLEVLHETGNISLASINSNTDFGGGNSQEN